MQCNIAKAHSCRKSRGRSNKLQFDFFLFFLSYCQCPTLNKSILCGVKAQQQRNMSAAHAQFKRFLRTNGFKYTFVHSILLDSVFSLFLSLSVLLVCLLRIWACFCFTCAVLCCAALGKCEPMCVEHIVHVHCDLYRSTGAAAGQPNNRRSVCIRSPISLFSLISTCKHKHK